MLKILYSMTSCPVYMYTARNATDLLQVADFTGLLQVVNKLQQAC
jgi:hypothetical protein